MATRGLPAWPHLNHQADSLPEAERLILDAARAWAGPGPAGPVGEAALILASAGAEGLAMLLDALLRALPGLQPGCRLCPRVSASEAWLLLALGAAQNRESGVALGLLQRLAPPLAAYQAIPTLVGLAKATRGAGLHVLTVGG